MLAMCVGDCMDMFTLPAMSSAHSKHGQPYDQREKLQSAVCTGISMPLTTVTRRTMCISKLRVCVNTAGRVVSSTKMAIHMTGRPRA